MPYKRYVYVSNRTKWDASPCARLHKNDPHSAGKPSTAHPSEKKKQPLLSTIYIKIKGVWKIHRTTQVSDPEFTHSTRQPILLKGKSALPPNHWWRKSYSEFLTQQLNGSCKRKQTVRCFLCFLFFFFKCNKALRYNSALQAMQIGASNFFFCRQ